MEKKKNGSVENNYQKFSDYTVKVISREKTVTRRQFGAKATILPEDGELWLVENKPRGPQSKEVARLIHSRMVRRVDGKYTLTMRFDADEKLLREKLLAECRNMANRAVEDREEIKKSQKK